MVIESRDLVIPLGVQDGPDAAQQIELAVRAALQQHKMAGWEPAHPTDGASLLASGRVETEGSMFGGGSGRELISVTVHLKRGQ